MAISPAFLGNYVTGRRHITKIKIDRWIVIFSILSVKWICKETKRNILSFVFKTIMYKYIKSPTYDVHNCSTIRMCGEKYMSGIVAQHCLSNQWRIWIFDHIPMNCIIVFFFTKLDQIKYNNTGNLRFHSKTWSSFEMKKYLSFDMPKFTIYMYSQQSKSVHIQSFPIQIERCYKKTC